MMSAGQWEFWIDVGGTFTDCIARNPEGVLKRCKILSTGTIKGAVGAGSSRAAIVDDARKRDPRDFWCTARLTLLAAGGAALASGEVAKFDPDSGALALEPALAVTPEIGQSYELTTGEEAPVAAIRYLMELAPGATIPPLSIRLGTTRGTNALVTRGGAPTAFITTRGFKDVLAIGYQNRPRLFELDIHKPPPLYATAIEIDERISATGQVLKPPDPNDIRRQLERLRADGIESLAICFLHGSEFPAHELIVAELAKQMGFEEISVSHRVMPLVKIVARGDTTVVDAYLNPVLRRYTQKLQQSLPNCDLRIVTSAGGLVGSPKFTGKDSLLSGPAAGVVGFSRVAHAAGFKRAIGFDMGGTSTDVSRFDGHFEFQYETEISGVRIAAPMLAIETVAAGGGSICAFDGVKLVVGPNSAGADPGPACYGRGGPLAVTDLNFYLGKIRSDRFAFPLDRAAVDERLKSLANEVCRATGKRYTNVELAEKLLQVANANMAKAIRTISTAKGYDPREYVLVPFGGAAGQHACAVAQELGIQQILHHPDAGLLSALGIGLADHRRQRVTGVYRPYSHNVLAELNQEFQRMEAEAIGELKSELSSFAIAPDYPTGNRESGQLETFRRLDLRYQGLDAALTIDQPADGNYLPAFTAEHRRLFGYVQPDRSVEIAAARIEVVWRNPQRLAPSERCHVPVQESGVAERQIVEAHFAGTLHATSFFGRRQLIRGQQIVGPAIIHETASTTVIDPAWRGEVLSQGEILVERCEQEAPATAELSANVACDPARLEIFNNHFAAIAEQMGIALRKTARSVNVKERLDFSCAIFDARGQLVVNAPHIPVHLGAMGETVRQIVADNPRMSAGDVFVTNDPYRGGSHVPDITVVTPVYSPVGTDLPANASTPELLFFTANRAHHAEIGGISPGSMPPFSKNLAEEGVPICNFKLVDRGASRFDELRKLLLAGPYPSRAVDDNMADIAAQVAANQQGARELLALVGRCSLPVVQAYMRHIQSAAETKMRQALSRLPPGRREFVDYLDDGTPIHGAVTIHSRRQPDSREPQSKLITVDFSGTGPVHSGNLNANRAIVTAAAMYVLRLLIAEDIPLNEGVLAPVKLILPECILNPPPREAAALCAAVAGGNVETSQRVVDVLLGALGLAAASQGTMNNLLFGNDAFGYYETICGGAGATQHGAGVDAVHTHMTNTRITDPEVLEKRFPVRVREFAIRRNSGGAGHHRGGNGVTRVLEFLQPLRVSILSQRRGKYRPYGLAGGSPGSPGRNTLTRADGQIETVPGIAALQVNSGDVLSIETPGGGGWGKSN